MPVVAPHDHEIGEADTEPCDWCGELHVWCEVCGRRMNPCPPRDAAQAIMDARNLEMVHWWRENREGVAYECAEHTGGCIASSLVTDLLAILDQVDVSQLVDNFDEQPLDQNDPPMNVQTIDGAV